MYDNLSLIERRLAIWKETYNLSFELADVTYTLLNVLVDYCKKNDVPLYRE